MKKRLKILHVISQRPDSTGSGIYLQEIMKESAKKGHENFLLAALPALEELGVPGTIEPHCHFVHFGLSDPYEKIVGMSDVMPYPSRKFQELDHEAMVHYLKKFAEPLSHMIKRHHPDIIHSHHLWLLTSLIKKQFPDRPLVTSCHGSDLRQFTLCPQLRPGVLEGCRHIDSVLSLTGEQKEEIAMTYGISTDNIKVTGAGYNPTHFHEGNSLKQDDRINLLYAGKISRAKGIPWLLRALDELTDIKFHLHLAGSGSGPEYEECNSRAERLGNRVTMHGMVSQHRLAELMRDSHIFILPSLHEGLPLVVLEALACGCITIATDLPGTREIKNRLTTDRLLLIENPVVLDTSTTRLADDRHFVNSLVRTLRQARLNVHESRRESGLSYFSWKSVFSRIEKCWQETLYKTS